MVFNDIPPEVEATPCCHQPDDAASFHSFGTKFGKPNKNKKKPQADHHSTSTQCHLLLILQMEYKYLTFRTNNRKQVTKIEPQYRRRMTFGNRYS
jgi:hypothetical protein